MENFEGFNLPLHEAWERSAAKELSGILHGLCSGAYPSPGALLMQIEELETLLRLQSATLRSDPFGGSYFEVSHGEF